jgi:GNAT superfamily N-acetyltransferase
MRQITSQADQFAHRIAAPRRFTQDYQLIGHDYMPTDVVGHYMMRKETGFGDEKSPLYELNGKPPLSQQISENGYEKPVELYTDGRAGYLGDGHHRVDIARQLGHSHVPVQVYWRKPYSDGSPVSGNKVEPWLKGWLTDMRRGRQTASRREAATTPGMPEGYRVKYWPNKYLPGAGGVTAHPVGQRPSGSNWHSGITWENHGMITHADTKPEYQGQGLARALHQHILDNYRPDLMHGPPHQLSQDGKAFAQAVGGQQWDPEEYKRRGGIL